MAKIALQTTFNRVVKHLRNQGCKAMQGDNCVYLDKTTGRRCAAGCLIPLKEYDKDFENTGVTSVNDKRNWNAVTAFIDSKGHNRQLVSRLQSLHDQYAVKEWENQFKIVAEEYKLKYEPPAKTN